MYKPVILPAGKQDIKEAAIWYNERQPGLGRRFTSLVRKTVHFICRNPNVVAVRYDNIRTALLDTFPFMIHYSVDEDKKVITEIAVLHKARDPKVWKERE